MTHDSAGRAITFDVRATSGADVPGYTAILDGLLHGAEISSVVVTVIPESAVATECGDAQAIACYRWSRRATRPCTSRPSPRRRCAAPSPTSMGITLTPPGPTCPAPGVLDGTASWWRARDMAGLLSRGLAAWDYSLGWDHSIAEIYAEDYAVTNGAGSSGIRWLGDPPSAVQDAIRADLAGAVAPPTLLAPAPAPAPAPQPGAGATAASAPAIARRSGRLQAGARARISFEVTDPERLSVRVSGATAGGCGGAALQRPPAGRRDRASQEARHGACAGGAGAVPRDGAGARRRDPVPGGRPRRVGRRGSQRPESGTADEPPTQDLRTRGLATDGKQFFVKFSYMLRF